VVDIVVRPGPQDVRFPESQEFSERVGNAETVDLVEDVTTADDD